VGYACFSLSSFLSWFETDTGLESKALAIAASALFTGGSVVLLYYATPPWGSKTYKPDCSDPISDVLFGAPRVWHGCFMFLVGSILFTAGAIFDYMGYVGTPINCYQAGITVFVPGRIFFLVDAIAAIKNGTEFRYGGTTDHVYDAAAALTIGLRMFNALEEAHMKLRGTKTEVKNLVTGFIDKGATPKGSWRVKAVKNQDGKHGTVTLSENGLTATLKANIKQPDGSVQEKKTTFTNEMDTFTIVNGEFKSGCSSGKGSLTTKQIVDLCEVFDLFDYSGTGLLNAVDLYSLVKAVGVADDVTLDDLKKVVKDLDFDGGRNTKDENGVPQIGLDFPEFLILATTALDGYNCHAELRGAWNNLDKDGDGHASRLELKALIVAMGFDEPDEAHLNVLIKHIGSIRGSERDENPELTKEDFYFLMTGGDDVVEDGASMGLSKRRAGNSAGSYSAVQIKQNVEDDKKEARNFQMEAHTY